MKQDEFDFSAPPPVMFPTHRVRKTITHVGSERRRQHVYIRMTERVRRQYNSVIGGFKHFMGAGATGADVFERYALPAMQEALKALAAGGQTT
jgi:hypothetical protein